MSYPYGQFTGENYSTTPPTPHDFPQWETVEHEEQQFQQQQQQQHSQEHTPTNPTPTFQLIHLEDTPLDPSQSPEVGIRDDTPIHLHHLHSIPPIDGRLDTLGKDTFRSLKYVDLVGSSSSNSASGALTKPQGASSSTGATTATTMALRSARSTRQHQRTLHPYQRPQSATGGGSSSSTVAAAAGPSRSMPMREGPMPLRFVHHNLNPPVPASSVPSAIPSPASAPGRMAGIGSLASSPATQLHSTLFNASPRIPDNPPSSSTTTTPPRKKYLIRTDVNYDPDTHVLTAMLELPGVKKQDVRVTLSTCYYNRVRQLTVSGTSYPTFPPSALQHMSPTGGGGDHTVRERRFGDFMRTFPVPSDLKREDVDAKLQDGVLILKIPCGPPAEVHDPQEIPVK